MHFTMLSKKITSLVLIAALALLLTNPAFAQLQNPLGTTDIRVIIGKIIKGLMGLSGTIALVVFIYGGFLWMFARGDSNEVKKGLDTMLWAGVGLIVIFGSYVVLKKIFEIIPQ